MRKLYKCVSWILVFSFVLMIANTVFLPETSQIEGVEVGSSEEIRIAQQIYHNLTPDARAIFDEALADDPELLEFHKKYVDDGFTLPSSKETLKVDNEETGEYQLLNHTESLASVVPLARKTKTDPMKILKLELAALGLPSAVTYSLKAMGASMVAAVADGPLPVGDILLAAASASAVVVIAANWKSVKGKWTGIVNAFKKSFSVSKTNVMKAFDKLKSKVNSQVRIRFNKSAESAVGKCNSNKQIHILKSKHNWKKIFPKGPDWKKISPVLIKVLKEGKETYEGNGVYIRTLVYKGQTVVVRFIKDAEGLVDSIGTAWVK